MRATLILATGLLLGGLSGDHASAAIPADQPIKLKRGAACLADSPEGATDATHRCFFSEGRFGRRDFTSRGARAEYVFTELGPDCEEVEILADEEFVQPDQSETLRRVSIICSH